MKSNERKWIVVLIVIILIFLVALVILINCKKEENDIGEKNKIAEEQIENYTMTLEDGTKINISEEFKSTKIYNGLEISNIQFTEKDGVSVLLADVKNTKSTKHETEIVEITILGENGEEITKIKPIIGEINSQETIKLNASITADVANAKDFKIKAKD